MIEGLPDRIAGIAGNVIRRLAWLCEGRPSLDRDDLVQIASLAALKAIRRHGEPGDQMVAEYIRKAILRAANLAAPVSGRDVRDGLVSFGPSAAASIERAGIEPRARGERPEPWPTAGLLACLDERGRACIEAYYGGSEILTDAASLTGIHRNIVRQNLDRSLAILRRDHHT